MNGTKSWSYRIRRQAIRAGRLLIVLALAGLAGCPSTYSVDKSREESFKQYETIIRWSQWDAAAAFIAPEYQEEHPISELQMDRLRLFKVTSYEVRSLNILADGMTAQQVVEIRLFSTTQAVERTIIDLQEWRYDPEVKRWWIYSGLPDPTQRR